jgi:lipopolysaccharide export LptBFGC system permease protein LptF
MGATPPRRTGLDRFRLFAGALALAALFLLLSATFFAHIASQASKGTREVLCIGIEQNDTNTARLDPTVVRLCNEVGVSPAP